MSRREDWPRVLAEYIDECAKAEFSYGSFDCCLFAADAVVRMTGVDFAAWFRGRYKTEVEAAVRLRQYTEQGDMPSTIAKVMEKCRFPEIGPMYAQRGDVILATPDDGPPTLGVCLSRDVAFPTNPRGLTMRSLLIAKRAWRIS